MTTRIKSAVPAADREDVLAAHACRYCGDLVGPFEVDHVKPLSRGGGNERSNLACACVSCNTQKSNMLLHEWIQWRTTNGMTWPPIASHATELVHYGTGCETCAMAGHFDRRVTPWRLERETGAAAYVAWYRCPRDGTRFTCWFSAVFGYFSDCPCGFCVMCRLEAAS